ncbi:MAG TPA: hypothetical protein ENH32_01950, partial [Proteobacteria bacterium]|nr:hypothetical protein [Pseudomonadota bacterium]
MLSFLSAVALDLVCPRTGIEVHGVHFRTVAQRAEARRLAYGVIGRIFGRPAAVLVDEITALVWEQGAKNLGTATGKVVPSKMQTWNVRAGLFRGHNVSQRLPVLNPVPLLGN